MSFLSQLFRDTLVYSFGNIVSKGISILLIPIYTRVLAPNEYGIFDIIIVAGSFFNIFWGSEIYQAVARRLADINDLKERRVVSSTALWFVLLSYSSFLLIFFYASPFITPIISSASDESIFIYSLGLIFIAVNGIYILLLNQFRWELRGVEYSAINFIYACCSIFLAVLFTFGLNLGLVGVLLAQVGAVGIASAICFYRLRASYGVLFDFTHLRELLSFSAPLVPASIAVLIILYANRLALAQFSGFEQSGIFAVASRISMMAGLMVAGIQAALTPLVYKHYKEAETARHLADIFNLFTAFALLLCVSVWLFSREIILLFSTSDYLDGAPILAILVPSVLLSQVYIFAPGIGIAKKTILQFWISVAAALVSVLANFLLVPPFGVWGAALATFVSSLVFWLLWVRASQRLYFIPYSREKVFLGICTALVTIFVAQYLETLFGSMLAVVIVKSIAVFVFVVLCVVMGLVSKNYLKKFVWVIN